MAIVTQFPTVNRTRGLNSWTAPNNAHADDAADATCGGTGTATYANEWETFGFDAVIPSGQIINAVKVIVEDGITLAAGKTGTLSTQPVVGGADQTLRTAANPAVPGETYPVVHTVDHTADRAWTRADLLDGTFRVNVQMALVGFGASGSANLDYVKVEVTYSPAPLPPYESGLL